MQSRAGTWSSHQTGAPNPSTTIAAVGVQGRYVRVQLSGTNVLALAEVQVFGSGTTTPLPVWSITKTHTGHFTHGQSGATYTVTVSNTGTGHTTGTTTVTDTIPSGLSLVAMLGSGWSCASATCTRSDSLPAGSSYQPITVTVNVASNASSQLTNQVTVSGGGTASSSSASDSTTIGLTNLALNKSATQSSTLTGWGPADAALALDGNSDGNFFGHSVSHTNSDSNAWWQVDLGATATMNHITIWNRTDSNSDRLSDYWVFASNTPFAASDTPATLQNRAGTWSSHQTAPPSPSTTLVFSLPTQARYIRVQLSGANYLSLAEVQVFGN